MKRKKQPRVLTLSILTTLTVLTWLAFEVWHAFTKQPLPQVDGKTTRAIDPKLDAETLQKLKTKLYFSDEEARRGLSATPAASPTASPTAQAGPSVTTSPTPTSQPAATGGTNQ